MKKWVMVGVATVGLVVAGVALWPSFRQAISSQQQADAAIEQNDRSSGRIEAKATVLELLPKKENMSHLMKAADARLIDVKTQKPAEFLFFVDMHALCTENPRLLLKNTGKEVIDGIKVEVEEEQVMPVGLKDPLFVKDPRNPRRPGLLAYKPNIDATLDDDGKLSEKFKPGAEAVVPIWKPLIRSILGAQQVPGNTGQYHGSFQVRCYVRAAGATAFDRVEGYSVPLGFTWASSGFAEKEYEQIQSNPIVVKILQTGANSGNSSGP